MDLYLFQASVVQTEALKSIAEERSISLFKIFDGLLEREQLAEESHAQEVVWFDERCSILESQQADQKQQIVEQPSTEIETLEQTLEGYQAKLYFSQVLEQEQLDAMTNLKQDIKQIQTDGGALLQEKTTLELACLAIQDRAVALHVGHEQKIDEFGMKLDDTEVS